MRKSKVFLKFARDIILEVLQAATLKMREAFRSRRSDFAKCNNISTRFYNTIKLHRGEICGWEPRNEFFDFDGIHLSDLGVDQLIEMIILALIHVPRFSFENGLSYEG